LDDDDDDDDDDVPIDEHMFQMGDSTTKAVLFGFV
jgi:hypothetical protein